MELTKKIELQRQFFASGATKDYNFRLASLEKLRGSIISHQDQILAALWQDLRKSEFEAYATEIGVVLNELKIVIGKLKKWMQPQCRPTPLVLFPSKSKIVTEPYGIALIIAPWNYPFQLTFSPLIGALAAGNCAILKPSPAASATAMVMEKIIRQAFSENHVLLINGSNDVTTQLLRERFDYIFYTGGVPYGREVMRAAAANLTPLTLELGGKSPCIVDCDANLAIAARRIVWGKFLNCGQTCVAPDYIMVDNKVREQLITELKREITRQFGIEVQLSPDYPRIINSSRFVQLVSLMDNGTVIYGGESDPRTLFIAPTLLIDVDLQSEIMQQEIFGPLLPIIGFDQIQSAINHINNNEKPLALYYFTESRSKAKAMIRCTTSGGACINDVVIHVANTNIPFGGVGNSGMGSYHGRSSFATFSHHRSVMSSTTRINIGVKFAPYKSKIKILKKLL